MRFVDRMGARFDDRATGKISTFAPNAKVMHCDIDAAEISKLRAVEVALDGNICDYLPSWRRARYRRMAVTLRTMKTKYAERYDAPGDKVFAPDMLRKLSVAGGNKTIVTSDVGQHQMWVAQH